MPIEEALHEEFTDLGDAEIEPPKWIIKNVLPVGMTVLIGAPKTHKSTILMMLATAVAGYKHKGLPAHMQEVVNPGRVLGFSAEATAGELRFMCEKGFDCKIEADARILVADNPWAWRLDEDAKQRKMLDWLDDEDLRPRLTFIDPFRNFHLLDEKDSGNIIGLLTPIREWHVKHNSALVLVHHTRKQNGEDGRKKDFTIEDARGSGALHGMADGVIVVNARAGNKRQIDLQFKRAASWSEEIQLGAWRAEEPPAEDAEHAKTVLKFMETNSWEATMKKFGVSKVRLAEWRKRFAGSTAETVSALSDVVSDQT